MQKSVRFHISEIDHQPVVRAAIISLPERVDRRESRRANESHEAESPTPSVSESRIGRTARKTLTAPIRRIKP